MKRFRTYTGAHAEAAGFQKFVIRSVRDDKLLRNAAKALDKIIQAGTPVSTDCWQAWADLVGAQPQREAK